MKIKNYDMLFIILFLIYIIDVIYLIIVENVSQNLLYCPNSGFIDCRAVINSSYSQIFNIKLPFLALAYILILSFIYFYKPKYSFYIWIIGIIFTIYLISSELFFIHHICIYCTIAQIDNLLFIIPLYYKRKEK